MIVLRRLKGGYNFPYHKRSECQLFQLAFLVTAHDMPRDTVSSDILWYCRNIMGFCFTYEMFRKLILPLVFDWEKRQAKIDELFLNPFLAEQLKKWQETPHKNFKDGIQEWYNFTGQEVPERLTVLPELEPGEVVQSTQPPIWHRDMTPPEEKALRDFL